MHEANEKPDRAEEYGEKQSDADGAEYPSVVWPISFPH
jgi:hypothetical protein